MIDKRIFYCWFGKGEMSRLNKRCIESWKKFCPDYEIVEINETNFDPRSTPYSSDGYLRRNFSAVSNTARLEYMCRENGFYLDTDVELLKSLDELRQYDAGFITEYESGQPDAGILGRGSICPVLYKNAKEHLVKGTMMHHVLLKDLYRLYDVHGESVQICQDGFAVLGEEFVPSIRSGFRNDHTIAIHHYENSWGRHPLHITDRFYPFQRVEVFSAGKRLFCDLDPEVTLTLLNRKKPWRSMAVLGRINYFFNPRVVKIETKDFIAERIMWDKSNDTTITMTANGMIVTHR